MGLDVYLYRYSRPTDEVESEKTDVEERSSNCWTGINDKSTQAQRDACRAAADAVYASAGWVKCKYGYSHPNEHQVEGVKSAKYPDHMFTIGYYRSSYNGAGFNSKMARAGVADLYGIFGAGNDEYVVKPDWQASKERAVTALEAWKKANDGLDIFELNHAHHRIEGDERQILVAAREELARHPFGDDGWQSGLGHFYPKGMKVVAIVNGKAGFLGTGTFIVTKTEAEEDWYGQALEIVIESIDYVLAQPDPNAYCFHWSG